MLADMDAFFASVEQVDNPQWRGRPLALTNGELGTCIITCSYEARACGVRTGMHLRAAKRLCPDLVRASSRPLSLRTGVDAHHARAGVIHSRYRGFFGG